MKRYLKEFIKRVIVLLLVIAQLLPVYNIPAAHAADKKDSKIRFNDFYGEVKIRPDSEEDDSYEFVDLDTVIYEGDRIKTEEDSGAILGLEDMSTYVIKPDSTLIIHTDEGNVSKIEMLAGSMWGNIKKMAEGKSLEIEMSQCVCGINGTTIYAQTSVPVQKKLDLNEIKKDADQIKNQVDKIQKDFDKAKNGEREQQQQAKLAKQKKVKNELSEKIENSSAPIIVPTKTTGNNSEAVLSNHQNTGFVVEKNKIDPEFGNNNENKSQTAGIQVQLVKPNEKNTNIETDNNNNNNNNKQLENIIKGIDYRRLNNGHDGLVGANKISEEEIKQKEQLEKIELKVLMSSPRPEVQTEQADIQKQLVNQLPQLKTNDQIQEERRQAQLAKLQTNNQLNAEPLQVHLPKLQTNNHLNAELQRDKITQVQTFDQVNTEPKQQTEMEKVLASLPKTKSVEFRVPSNYLNGFNKNNNNSGKSSEEEKKEQELEQVKIIISDVGESNLKKSVSESKKVNLTSEQKTIKPDEEFSELKDSFKVSLKSKVSYDYGSWQTKQSKVDALASTGNNSEAVLSNPQNTGLVVKKDKIDPEFGNNNENKSQTAGIQVQLVKPNEKNTNIETDNNNNNNNNNDSRVINKNNNTLNNKYRVHSPGSEKDKQESLEIIKKKEEEQKRQEEEKRNKLLDDLRQKVEKLKQEEELKKQEEELKKEEGELKKEEEEIEKRREERLKNLSELEKDLRKNKNLSSKDQKRLKEKVKEEQRIIEQQTLQEKKVLQEKQLQTQKRKQALQEQQDQVQQKRQTLQEKQANLRAQQNDQLDTGLASTENNSQSLLTGKNVVALKVAPKTKKDLKKVKKDTKPKVVVNLDDNNQQNNNNNENNEKLSEEELKKQEEERKKQEEERKKQEALKKQEEELKKQEEALKKQEEELKKQEEELKKQEEEIAKRKDENLKNLTDKVNELKNNKKLTKKQQKKAEKQLKKEQDIILQQEKQERQALQEKQGQVQQERQALQEQQDLVQQKRQSLQEKQANLNNQRAQLNNNGQQIDIVANVKNEPQIKDVIAPVNNNHQPNIADRVDSIAAKLNNEAQQKNNPAKTTAPGVAPGKPQASDAAGVVNNRATKVEDAANGVKNNAQKVQQMDGKVHYDMPKVEEVSVNKLNKAQQMDGKVRPQNKAQMGNRTDTVKVLKGTATITNKATKETFKVPAGNQATIAGNVVKVEPIINLEKDQNELNQQLDRSNDKQSTKQLIDKLNGQTGQINDSKKPVDNMLDTIKKLLDGNSPADKIKQASAAYTKAVEEGKRFVSIFVEVNSTINVLSKRISADSVMVVSSDESEAAADAIKKANEAMNSFSQSLEALVGYADKIEEKTGTNPLDSLTSQAENANEIKETIVSSNGEIDEVTKGITDESSYSDFKNAITRCEALLRDLQNLNERLTANEVGTEALAALKKQFLGVYLKVEKAIKDYSSVPEIKSATLKQMKDFDKDVPSFSSDIIKHLKEYKAINSSSTDAKKRYVESATRTLASYDRMRRVYTKANRMYTQMEKEFKQSKFKTAEYNDVKDSWEKIEQAMTTIDSEASELSSCVEDLKSQLESLLGK